MATKYSTFVGIDVSKEKLDLCLRKDESISNFIVENNEPALAAAFRTDPVLNKIRFQKTLFCFESIGFYNHHLIAFLRKKRAKFSIQSPLHIKLSMGLVRGKSDKLDAERIALFASRNHNSLRLWEKPRDIILQLEQLKVLRKRLVGIRTILTMPLKEGLRFSIKSNSILQQRLCEPTLTALKNDIGSLEELIKSLIKNDQRLNRLYEVLTSVHNIGFVLALNLIVITDEFKRFETASQLASYIGVVPFGKTSGSSLKVRPRISFHANKELKSLLHMTALGSIRKGSNMRAYYERKTVEGKHPNAVLNAIKNKIIRQLFTCVEEDRFWKK